MIQVIITRKNGKNYCEVFDKTFTVIKKAINYAYNLSDDVEIIDKR